MWKTPASINLQDVLGPVGLLTAIIIPPQLTKLLGHWPKVLTGLWVIVQVGAAE